MSQAMCTFECPAGVGGMDHMCSKERDKMSQAMCTFECPAGTGGTAQYV